MIRIKTTTTTTREGITTTTTATNYNYDSNNNNFPGRTPDHTHSVSLSQKACRFKGSTRVLISKHLISSVDKSKGTSLK